MPGPKTVDDALAYLNMQKGRRFRVTVQHRDGATVLMHGGRLYPALERVSGAAPVAVERSYAVIDEGDNPVGQVTLPDAGYPVFGDGFVVVPLGLVDGYELMFTLLE